MQSDSVKGEVRVEEPTAAQRTVARRTAEARATVPHVEMATEISIDDAPTERLVRACAMALREVPHANAAYRDGRFELYSRINVGVVVTGGDTYAIPTVFDADQKPLPGLAAELEQLRQGALARTLASPAFSGATFTVWNAGAQGLTSASPVINPPQAAAVAFGAVRATLVTATLACDHRILYGERASRLLAAIKSHLERGT